jgi:carbonic anhydrase
MKKFNILFIQAMAVIFILSLLGCSSPPQKPNPDQALNRLKLGNARFVKGESTFPHMDSARIKQAGEENQGDHAYATIITCSDSRVPVELVFDAGIMDTFVIRVAGNVCDTDEIGSIEYGLAHVNTPAMVVLGHTQCGAVTAVTQAALGNGHALERNIPPLVDNIGPAVAKTISLNPGADAGHLIPLAIQENVWTGIQDLFMESPATRDLVKAGKVKVVGAIYDVGTGKVNWLDESKVGEILAKVEADPDRAIEAMAGDAEKEAAHAEESKATDH